MILYILFTIFYVLMGKIFYDASFAYWQRKWPSLATDHVKEDKSRAMWYAVLWPMTILVVTIAGDWAELSKYYNEAQREGK